MKDVTRQRRNLEAWLGPMLYKLTTEQVDRIEDEFYWIAVNCLDPKDDAYLQAELIKVVKSILSEV